MADSNSFVWRDFVEETLDGSRCVYLEPADGEFIPEQSVLRIITSSTWARDSIQRRHTPAMKAALQRQFPNQPIELEYVVAPENDTPRPARVMDDATEIAPALPIRQRGPAVVPIGKDRPSGLNPQYVFERFIIGSSNRLAAATAMSVSERPVNGPCNLLFLSGGSGLGKTHLLHAIGNAVVESDAPLKTLYVSAETFLNDTIRAISNSQTELVRNKYRTNDVLLMDDVQILQKKEQTQIEFLHTFNDLYNANKLIVLASDDAPNDMSEIEERIKTRFLWGVTARIYPPEFETRVAILQRKAVDIGAVELEDEAAEYLAERISSNIRELEGALMTAFQHARLLRVPISADVAQEALGGDANSGGEAEIVTSKQALEATADFYRVSASDLKSKRRTKRIAYARHMAMYLCRQMTDDSLMDIGREFGGRDHSTVHSACLKIEKEAQEKPQTAETIEKLKHLLQGGRLKRGRLAP